MFFLLGLQELESETTVVPSMKAEVSGMAVRVAAFSIFGRYLAAVTHHLHSRPFHPLIPLPSWISDWSRGHAYWVKALAMS